MVRVKKNSRRYDARGRLEQARRGRETIVEAARSAFLEHGFAATTIASIAQAAGVSVETIYKAFGGKTGLVRAVYEQGLAGRAAVPAPQRSDALSATENDPRRLIRYWGKLTAEVSPLVSPILLLVRDAAAGDPELVALLEMADAQRRTRMRKNAAVLAKRGFLRAGLSLEAASDILWAYTSPELYELLVLRRGWSASRFGDFVASALEAALLSP